LTEIWSCIFGEHNRLGKGSVTAEGFRSFFCALTLFEIGVFFFCFFDSILKQTVNTKVGTNDKCDVLAVLFHFAFLLIRHALEYIFKYLMHTRYAK
jgi:hypothetical protein